MHSARLGLVVGKKAVAKAHARNRIKRIIRSRFRLARAGFGALDLVIRVTAPVTAAELHGALDTLFVGVEKSSLERPSHS